MLFLHFSASAQTNCSFSLGADTNICGAINLTLNPQLAFTADSDSLTIVYDATQGNSQLFTAQKVYMHSSIENDPFSGWSPNHIVGNWGMDDGIGEMRSAGNNLWQITMHPPSYYGYHPDSMINGLFMVFRNENGDSTGKTAINEDFWVDINIDPPQPNDPAIDLNWQRTSGAQSLLWSDGSTDSILLVTQPGTYWVEASFNSGCIFRDSIVVESGNAILLELGEDTTNCEPASPVILQVSQNFDSYMWSNGSTTNQISAQSGGLYWLEVRDGAGCSGRDSIRIEVGSGLVVRLGADTSFCQQSFNLNLNAGAGFDNYLWSDGSTAQQIAVSNSGVYSVTASDAVGCASSDTIEIQSGQGADANFTFTLNDLDAAFSAVAGAQNYSWDFDNDGTEDATGEQVSYQFPEEGTYIVTLTVTDACGTNSSNQLVNIVTTGIETQGTSQIRVYPNPANNEIYIEGLQNALIEKGNLLVYDLAGNLLFNTNALEGNFPKFALPHLPDGRYFIQIDQIGLPLMIKN